MKGVFWWTAFFEKLICEEKFLWGFAKTWFPFTSKHGIIFPCSTFKRNSFFLTIWEWKIIYIFCSHPSLVILCMCDNAEWHCTNCRLVGAWEAHLWYKHRSRGSFTRRWEGINMYISWGIRNPDGRYVQCTILHCQFPHFLLNLPKWSFKTKDDARKQLLGRDDVPDLWEWERGGEWL